MPNTVLMHLQTRAVTISAESQMFAGRSYHVETNTLCRPFKSKPQDVNYDSQLGCNGGIAHSSLLLVAS